MAESKTEAAKRFEESRNGIVTFEDGLGYFIQPEDNDRAVVGFNGIDYYELPEGLEVGQKVKFKLDKESQGVNASEWTKFEDEKR